ncbi:MAG: (2Fe-2S)-binding protein [Defluviitaleaceae bacterium]|nr:(2Fe-2S)-binding protein [Defluviitaleaceae bacterium]
MSAAKKIICEQNNIDYITIRMAMVEGVRTLDELKTAVNVCGECSGCSENLDGILSSVCGCKKVSLQDVVSAVKDGADTTEKVGEITKAGTACGRCKVLIENVIELGR